jgi:TP901-1 family phage major tail protein
MSAQKGKDLLLKMDADGQGNFTTMAGLRSSAISFNAASVDITHAESAGRWRQLLAGAGVRNARIAGAGIFKDAASDERVRQLFFDGEICDWRIVIPDFGVISGPFQISALEFSGEHDREVSFELTLESAGELSFSVI